MKLERIGNYRVERVLSSGGMAIVYEAVQEHPHRQVAVKVLRRSFSSASLLRRFRYEAEILARLNHPHIAQVIEAGTHIDRQDPRAEDGVGIPFLVMEYVHEARPITSYATERDLSVRQRLGLFLQVCDGVHHGHQKGIIHRDIKPSNILVDGSGQAKVIDFGIARATDSKSAAATSFTELGRLIGTVQYMSPEQCTGDPDAVDVRSDVYALGGVLYELLCDELPYDVRGAPLPEAARVIHEVLPRKPSAVKRIIRGDLETIVLKALEKEPARRYQSVAGLADDLRRLLRGEVIRARPASAARRLGKCIRRNPRLSGTVGVTIVAVAGLLGYVLGWSYPRLQEAYGQIRRLSDVRQLSNLEQQAEELWPAVPESVPVMTAWIEEADALVARLDDHRRRLAELRRQAVPAEISVDARGTREVTAPVFSDVETQWQHETLAGLVSRLEAFTDPDGGVLPDVRARAAFASTVEKLTVDDHRAEWDSAIASIASLEECPQYDGLRIAPQPGLVPIGRDPDSGLWEFANVQTGEIPRRDEYGRLLLTERTGLVFVLVPGGTFRMGSMLPTDENPVGTPNVDPLGEPDERPVHDVTLRAFLMSKYEMTQGQWLRFTGENPSYYDASGPDRYKEKWNRDGDPHSYLLPVSDVSWEVCADVLFKLGLRLPSEAEWEYAARGGTTTPWWTGERKESLARAENIKDLFSKLHSGYGHRWTFEEWMDDGHVVCAPVGSYRANPFGLHDVCGNNMEWVQDAHHSYSETPADGSAHSPMDAEFRVARGGHWAELAHRCRSADRARIIPTYREKTLGVRPAASLR